MDARFKISGGEGGIDRPVPLLDSPHALEHSPCYLVQHETVSRLAAPHRSVERSTA
jgi:hypothetical protein